MTKRTEHTETIEDEVVCKKDDQYNSIIREIMKNIQMTKSTVVNPSIDLSQKY